MPTRNPITHATIIDATSLFDACAVIGERFNRKDVKIDYPKLKERLGRFRSENDWPPADVTLVLLAIDPASEGQQRFAAMLRHSGFEPDVIHYRDAFVSLPPGRSPSDTSLKSNASFAARIAYITGLLARHQNPSVLAVTHAFELCGPLTDLKARCASSRVGIAFFGSLMDYRWKLAGAMNENRTGDRGGQDRGIEFLDLDDHGDKLLGVDLISRATADSSARGGLNRF